jgi:hypothetical protein
MENTQIYIDIVHYKYLIIFNFFIINYIYKTNTNEYISQ